MKYITALLLLSISLSPLFSQGDRGRRPQNDQIRAQRAAFITQRLQLTTEEATHFWASFNEYEAERDALEASYEEVLSSTAQGEEEAARQIEARFQLEEDVIRLKRQFYEQVSAQVPATKLVQLSKAEREFKRSLLQRLEQRRPSGRQFNRGG